MADEHLKERINELEDELANTKANKRTEMAIGLLKAKIARLKEELEQKQAKAKGKGEGYAVKKEGDATIGFLGKPSVGKSTLLTKMTNKESKIGHYDFTTLEVVPGLLHHNFTNLQILDLPGIIKNAADNKGFGKKVLSVVRVCDLIVILVNAKKPSEMEMLLTEIQKAGIRVNKTRPFIEVKRTHHGGIEVPINMSEERIPKEMIEQILHDNKIVNAEVMIHEEGLEVEDFIDAVYSNMVYTRGVVCLNKIDLCTPDELKKVKWHFQQHYPSYPLFGVSGEQEINLEKFKDFLWGQMDFIWVYLKEQRKEPDLEKPLVLREGATVEDLCKAIHKDFVKKFRYAKVKGPSAKFAWQRIGLDHVVQHNDIVELTVR